MLARTWLKTRALNAVAFWAIAGAVYAAGSAADGRLDSEASLVARRAARFEQLPRPAAPPEVKLPAAGKHEPAPSLSEIDRFIYASWREAKLPEADNPPPLCDDATFCRRIYLDLIGVIPAPVDLNHFLADRAADKRTRLIDRLLARDDEYAAHWTPFWEDALASQTVLSQGGIPTRGDYRAWIYNSLRQNRAYDVMVAELIDPTMPGRHGAVTEDLFGVKYNIEYVRNEDHTVTLQTAANVGQVFLGTGMKCASCHDHFDNAEWTQERFLGFAGLFAPHDLERLRCDVPTGQTVPAKFPFEVPGAAGDVPSDLDARLHWTAQLVTDPLNPRFAMTIVNRLWRRYLGLGLYEPADDFRSDMPASQPRLLEWLAYDFVEHGCDLKHTIRRIVSSRTYQRRYQAALEDHFDAADRALPRYYRSPSLRRMTAEQTLDSLRLVLTNKLDPEQRCYLDARSTALMRALGRPASRNEISTARPNDVAVVQALELLNGQELHDLIDQCELSFKPALRRDPRRIIDQLYLTALTRHATSEEKRFGKEVLPPGDSQDETIRDLLWALICSPEFQYIK